VSEWQPIETAPKENRDVLVCEDGIGKPVRVAFWDKARGGVWSMWPGRERIYPTHWMPLPAPPVSRIRGEKA
jgi:hypothetical protein